MQELKSKITKLKKKSQWNLKVNWISQKKGELEDKTMENYHIWGGKGKKGIFKKWRKPKEPVHHHQEDQHMYCGSPRREKRNQLKEIDTETKYNQTVKNQRQRELTKCNSLHVRDLQ